MWLAAKIIKTHFMSRSFKESSLMVAEDFKFFIKTKDAFKGYFAVVLKASHAEKKNTQKEKYYNIIYIPIYQINPDNPLDEYNIVNTLINVVIPPEYPLKEQNTQNFRYIATRPQLKVSHIVFVSVCTYIYLMCDVCFCLNCYG